MWTRRCQRRLEQASAALPALLLFMSGCLPFQSSEDAGISFRTTPVPWPEDTECVEEGVRDTAYELLSQDSFIVVANSGTAPINADQWADFDPPAPWVKNSTRNLLFSDQCFSRSPDASPTCSGTDCEILVDISGYTWVELSQIVSIDCIPQGKACSPSGLKEGELAFIITSKCHKLTFEGDVTFLNGPDGERAIMHAYGESGAPDTTVGLPEGWTLSAETLSQPLDVYPAGESGDCYFPIIRDAFEQSYHQFEYAGPSYP